MTNVRGNASGFLKATTTDPELQKFDAEEMFYSVVGGRSLQGWASLSAWPNERRNIAFNFVDGGDIPNQTFDFATSPEVSATWWKSTSGSSESPYYANSGTVTVSVNAATDTATAKFHFTAVAPNGKDQVTVAGELDLAPNDQGSVNL
ncbi:hypothetical protein [Pseudomonas sp. TWP3-2]|uniref:hypothetical protein n=1 Tax=Pseudomonas sp. TWP3-2 TaxID=2804574 RepID=UPI003CEA66DA